ncbi:MAG TPA: hypothetical protein DCY13_05430 [Verrucomicrobiales bacterium]|nr:hypothetical protein [Verrucomicrobiales bacterium]
MKNILTLLATVSLVGVASASLKPGDSLTPYEIQNTESGAKYCQVCAYSPKSAKIIAFGKLGDAEFWADLKKLQKLHSGYDAKGLGVFAQILDSTDTKAINAKAKEHGITFPVVVAVEKDWNDAYKVDGVSRTIYYAQKNRVAWTGVGLSETELSALTDKVKEDAKG